MILLLHEQLVPLVPRQAAQSWLDRDELVLARERLTLTARDVLCKSPRSTCSRYASEADRPFHRSLVAPMMGIAWLRVRSRLRALATGHAKAEEARHLGLDALQNGVAISATTYRAPSRAQVTVTSGSPSLATANSWADVARHSSLA
jgi:hypothetical protein